MITIVGYGLGNIQAFMNIYKRLGIPTRIATTADDLAGAEKLILPGVGAFDWAMDRLNDSGMRTALDDLVLGQGKPVLGVCVGMQMMANSSEEGCAQGLGWIDASVKKLTAPLANHSIHLPHMGWNDVHPKPGAKLFQGIEGTPRFYFLHSFYFLPIHDHDVLATTDYAVSYCSATARENIYGVQFHPEKSHNWGITLLKNFAEI